MGQREYSLEEAAELIGTAPSNLAAWARYGLVPSKKNEQFTAFSHSDLERISPRLGRSHEKITDAPRVVSFFSGCGGLDLGFQNAGFHLGFANDFFAGAAKSYLHNIGSIDPRSIYEISTTDVGPADVILAGFPCQPFSNAGSRRGVSDPRGTLFWETLRFVEALKPKVVVFENVRGLLSMKNPDGGLLIDAIVREVESRGYRVSYKLLNAHDYGVPQNRYRVIVVGVLSTHFAEPFDFEVIPRDNGGKLGEAIENLPNDDPNDEHWELSPQAKHLIEYIPAGGSWKSVPYDKLPTRLKRIRDNMSRYHSPNFYRRFALTEVMGTVTAAATPENSGILHPHEPRRYSVREVARFQTFPDTFIFQGNGISEKYKQIGNAVPPELARRLGEALMAKYFKL
jgi:DNA (cytosine-5)-methyltransferase 1